MKVFTHESDNQQFLVVDDLSKSSPIPWIVREFFSPSKYYINETEYLTEKGYKKQLVLQGLKSEADLILAKHFILSVLGVDKVLAEFISTLQEEDNSFDGCGDYDDDFPLKLEYEGDELFAPF